MSDPLDVVSLPDPGIQLIRRVAGDTERIAFYESGRDSVRELRRTLEIVGRRLESFSALLDFGCGCGRMMFWLQELPDTVALHGTDIDAEAIVWCQENLPRASFAVNGSEPPTGYGDATFDLVVNHSVFTHIDERLQDLWLTELRRITKPGALLVLSVHGEAAIPEGAWEIRDELESTGFSYRDGSVSPELGLPTWYQNAWHAPWYVFQHWQQWFRIQAYLPAGALGLQDQILLERLDGAPRPPLAARAAADRDPGRSDRVQTALEGLRRYQVPVPTAGATGLARHLLRTSVLKLMRPYTFHQQRFNEAVATTLRELSDQIMNAGDQRHSGPPDVR